MNTEGIILAAGLSSRIPSYKMTLNLYGKTVIERSIESMLPFVDNLYVVTGYNHKIIRPLIDNYIKVNIIFNEDYKKGMFESVKLGLKHISAKRFFLLPGDIPLVNNKTYEQMLNFEQDIVIPRFNQNRGHPILIKQSLIKEILSNNNLTSLREFLINQTITYCDVLDEGILLGINTLDDYQQVLAFTKGLENGKIK